MAIGWFITVIIVSIAIPVILVTLGCYCCSRRRQNEPGNHLIKGQVWVTFTEILHLAVMVTARHHQHQQIPPPVVSYNPNPTGVPTVHGGGYINPTGPGQWTPTHGHQPPMSGYPCAPPTPPQHGAYHGAPSPHAPPPPYNPDHIRY